MIWYWSVSVGILFLFTFKLHDYKFGFSFIHENVKWFNFFPRFSKLTGNFIDILKIKRFPKKDLIEKI